LGLQEKRWAACSEREARPAGSEGKERGRLEQAVGQKPRRRGEVKRNSFLIS